MTPPPEALAAPVSDRAGPDDTVDLICPARDIFDAEAVNARILERLGDAADDKALRAAAVSVLREAQAAGRAAIADAFLLCPRDARQTVRAYAWLTDGIVRTVFQLAVTRLHPRPNPTQSERLAVLAVGGYGRAEMAPFSDVDLLFLTPYKITGWAESVIESMLYMLWDLHLKVGHSSRTVKDCIRLGREDYTIRTALLENRFIDGYEPLAQTLKERLRADLFRGSAADFIEAKLAERDTRHRK